MNRYRSRKGKKEGNVSSILTFSSRAYASQEEQNRKHLFQFAQVFHTAPCHQSARDFPLLCTKDKHV